MTSKLLKIIGASFIIGSVVGYSICYLRNTPVKAWLNLSDKSLSISTRASPDRASITLYPDEDSRKDASLQATKKNYNWEERE